MSKTPEFIEFAAIQVFAAMVGDPRRGCKSFQEDAIEAWRVAKVLYDAKPVENAEALVEKDRTTEVRKFAAVIDEEGNYGIYEGFVFVGEARVNESNTVLITRFIRDLLSIPNETAFDCAYYHVDTVVGNGNWPQSFNEALLLDA